MALCIPLVTSKLAVRGLSGLVCVAGLLIAGRNCEGSCGDYVILKSQHSLANQDLPAIPVPHKAPCNSPVCRGEVPPAPVAPAPSVDSPTQKPLALLTLSLELDGNGFSRDWPSLHEQARPGFRSPLQRPPSR